MASVSPLISELGDRIELSDERRKERRRAARDRRHVVNENNDQLQCLCEDTKLWAEAGQCGHGVAPLAQIRMRLRSHVEAQRAALKEANAAAEAAELADEELVTNAQIIVLRAVESLATRPADAVTVQAGASFAHVFAPQTRVDTFNPALGEVQPPRGNGDDAARSDPTDFIPISDM